MNDEDIKLLAGAVNVPWSDLSLESKIVSVRYAMEVGEITPEKMGQILQGLLDELKRLDSEHGGYDEEIKAIPKAADAEAVNAILEKFK